ncbi:MAG: GntR family transcriptional regulator [Candidatus Hydrothermia bacterium]
MTLIQIEKPEFDANLPIFLQIMNFVKKLIVRGVLKPGEKVPSVREMAMHLGVNPNTVQKAYDELEKEGIIFTKRGQGNFVSENPDLVRELKNRMLNEAIKKLVSELYGLGFSIDEIKKILKELEL